MPVKRIPSRPCLPRLFALPAGLFAPDALLLTASEGGVTVGRRSEAQLEPSGCRGRGSGCGGGRGGCGSAMRGPRCERGGDAHTEQGMRKRGSRDPRLLHLEGSPGQPGFDIGNNGGSGMETMARVLGSGGD